MSIDERREYLDERGALDGFARIPELETELHELIDYEINIATASWDCVDVREMQQIYWELEREFVETHAAEIEALAVGDQ